MPEAIRIAVIDSGVHPRHPHIDARRIVPGASILADGTLLSGGDETLDTLGHGTAVSAVIQDNASEAILVPVRVFRDSLATSACALAGAIRWSFEQRVDLINLSLGSVNPAHHDVFSALAEEAQERSCAIVAAREADGVSCWPGCLPQVIGVGLDWDIPRGECRVSTQGDGPVVLASGFPRPIPGVPQQRNLYGISFAVAHVTGLAAALGRKHQLTREALLDLLAHQSFTDASGPPGMPE